MSCGHACARWACRSTDSSSKRVRRYALTLPTAYRLRRVRRLRGWSGMAHLRRRRRALSGEFHGIRRFRQFCCSLPPQRHAWYPYFDDINAIIFLAPINCFDEQLAEDLRVNRLQDSVLLWKAVCSTKLLAKVQLILVSGRLPSSFIDVRRR